MFEVVARGVARATLLHAWLCYRTSRFAISPEAERVLAQTWDRGVPTVYVFWHDEFVLNSLLAYCARLHHPVCAANDRFGGEVSRALWTRCGAPVVSLLRNETREEKLTKLADALGANKRLVLAADYGRPWFRARPTAFRIAKRARGVVVPMHLNARYSIRVRREDHVISLPLPCSEYALHLGDPLSPSLGESVLTERLEHALFGLRAAAAELDEARRQRIGPDDSHRGSYFRSAKLRA